MRYRNRLNSGNLYIYFLCIIQGKCDEITLNEPSPICGVGGAGRVPDI